MTRSAITKIAAAVLGVAAAVVLIMRIVNGSGGFDPQAYAKPVTIVCSETGETWEVEGGRLKDMLYQRPAPLDPAQGLPSAKAGGKFVGFPEDRKLWEAMVAQVNAEKAALAASKK